MGAGEGKQNKHHYLPHEGKNYGFSRKGFFTSASAEAISPGIADSSALNAAQADLHNSTILNQVVGGQANQEWHVYHPLPPSES